MTSEQKYIPGVLGGMGPQATVDFLAKVVSQTDANCDQDHIRLLVDHNPKLPDRHAAIKGDGREVGAALADMASGLERAGADFLVMVCNTAHAFRGDIEKAVDIPFVSIIDEVVSELDEHWRGVKRVGVMAAEGCLETGLYQKALVKTGRKAINWSAEELDQFMALIYQIKSGVPLNEIKPRMERLAYSLHKSGAGVLIAGCTEIPLVLSAAECPVPLLASTDILVASTIDYAVGNKALPSQ
jgi:aspartate racemase